MYIYIPKHMLLLRGGKKEKRKLKKTGGALLADNIVLLPLL